MHQKGAVSGLTLETPWLAPKGADSMAVSGLSFTKILVGSGWATAVIMHELVEKTVLLPCTAPISGREAFFPSLDEQLPAESCDYCGLIFNRRVWFESQTCRGWLQEHLCEVWGLKTQQNCKLMAHGCI